MSMNPQSETPDNNDYNFKLTVLGTRGSMPVSGPDTAKYGHATSSYLLETDKEDIILDAGNGILNHPDFGEKRISLLVTHSHIDHILGLPMFLGQITGKELSIYGATRDGLTMKQQLEIYMKRPLWPVGFEVFPVKFDFCGIAEEGLFHIGEVEISSMESNHPGGSSIFKLTHNGKSIVYATDFEHDRPYYGDPGTSEDDVHIFKKLVDFCRDADLVLYDAQYTPQEYEKCRGFGHSTYVQAVELFNESHAKEMLLVHHAPNHTDRQMDELAKELPSPRIRFAKEGDIWTI